MALDSLEQGERSRSGETARSEPRPSRSGGPLSPRGGAARAREIGFGIARAGRDATGRARRVSVPLAQQIWRGRKRIGAYLNRFLPERLFPRSLLIIVLPMVILQSVLTLVFMERHWNEVTRRLSDGVVRDIAALIEVIETYPADNYVEVERIARDALDLNVKMLTPAPLPPPTRKPFFTLLDSSLAAAIGREIGRPFWIDTVNDSNIVRIIIRLDGGNLRVFAPRSRAYASNSHIFLVWMVGTAIVLIGVAVLFLRGQVRPIQLLADAAESFGRGQPTPPGFRPRGATEVRRAGLAFVQMRERIERQMEQRTTMLTGVSHDLRTILTRFRLQLAVATPDELDAELRSELQRDLDDMQSMLTGYMDFARGEGEETIGELSLRELAARCRAEAEARDREIAIEVVGDDAIAVRPTAVTRLVMNLVTNACRYARTIEMTITRTDRKVVFVIDDDGPGIPPDRIEDAFRPFVRLGRDADEDRARNQDVGGTGLGLSIARDIARSHGGDVVLSESPLGGLRARVRLPL